MDNAIHSGQLEKSEIPHYAAIDRELYKKHFNDARGKYAMRKHFPTKHQLHKSWSTVMGPKTWPTVSEETLRQRAAAWQWLVHMAGLDAGSRGDLDAALMSRVMVHGMLVSKGDVFWFSLGNYSWAVLALRLNRYEENVPDGDPLVYYALPHDTATAEWHHITAPSEWSTTPYEYFSQKLPSGRSAIVLHQVGPPEGLTKAFLRKRIALLKDDLLRLVRHFGLNPTSRTKPGLLRCIAEHVGGGSEEFVEEVTTAPPPKKDVTQLLCDDPLFEDAFEDLPDDDKKEHRDITATLKAKRKANQAIALRSRAAKRSFGERIRAGLRRKRRRLEPEVVPEQVVVVVPQPVPLQDEPVPVPNPAAVAAVEPAPEPNPAAVARQVQNAPLHRCPRGFLGEPFGSKFTLAPVHTRGVHTAWSATCNLHVLEGQRCNINLTMGTCFTEDEAKRRVKKWCLLGPDIADGPGARKRHMDKKPRTFNAASLDSHASLDSQVTW